VTVPQRRVVEGLRDDDEDRAPGDLPRVIRLLDAIMRGIPVRGKLRKTTLRYDFSPVLRPIQKGELPDRQSRCGMK
jgi:hypothetical protein